MVEPNYMEKTQYNKEHEKSLRRKEFSCLEILS
jgi:hypothetical protein